MFDVAGFASSRLRVCIVGAAALAALAPARGQCPADWSLAASSGPAVRSYHGLAYDRARGTTVLYGGANGSTLRADVWEWDGAAWGQVAASGGAGARRAMALSYDSARDRLVSFGGVTASGINGETWEWNGSWTQVAVGQPAPAARGFLPGVYDEAHGNSLVFGGWGGGFAYFGDTWLWDGSDWTQALPVNAPSPRAFHAAAYDAARGRVVLFGGLFISGSGTSYYADTWEWDGLNWSDVTPSTSPGPRAYHALAYDRARQRVVLFGGFSVDHGVFADTWEWDGSNWTEVSPANVPVARQNHALAFDEERGQSVMFGGEFNGARRGDTWRYVTAFPAPDLNQDGHVDLQDLAGLLAHFGVASGAVRADGDVTGDGAVDLSDLSLLLAAFGVGCQ